ncbi:MAG: sn-glycerol-3-phosphate ABC transporter ATP-binding protein UgpC [Pseudomonadota bacterium]
MADLKLNKLKKSFGPVDVIHSVDLEINSGEFVVFVGPSGCGKSTLLRLVAGLEEATSGQLVIGDRDVTHIEAADRGVAMVFQSYALYPHMTVRENMSFGLKMNKAPEEEIKARVAKAAKILELDALLDRTPKQLSGGQRQRVAIGRSIVREPKVFLFDEPLSNLDAELRVAMRVEIAKLHNDLDATMIYVTHDQVEAMTLADKIVVLRGGHIEQVGAPLHLYDDPDNIFVAGFIGSPSMNFLDAKVVKSSSGSLEITLPDYPGAVANIAITGDAPANGTALKLGIRPEHFDPAGDVKLTIRPSVVEHLGGASYIYAEAKTEAPLVIESREGRDVRIGTEQPVAFHSSQAYLFDAASGLRIR